VRFSRLADESRRVYSTKIVDKITTICKEPVYICGSNEMKKLVMSESPFPLIEPNFVNANRKKLIDALFIEMVNLKDKVDQVLRCIQTNPDLLVFGQDVNAVECEYILTVDREFEDVDKYIYISYDSKYYEKIYKFVTIGKKYYV